MNFSECINNERAPPTKLFIEESSIEFIHAEVLDDIHITNTSVMELNLQSPYQRFFVRLSSINTIIEAHGGVESTTNFSYIFLTNVRNFTTEGFFYASTGTFKNVSVYFLCFRTYFFSKC